MNRPRASWERVPEIPFVPFEDGPPGALPVVREGLTVHEAEAGQVAITVAGKAAFVPRYWLARMLSRIALHRPLLGYVETYGGFFFDDRGPMHRMGVRGAGEIALAPADSLAFVETLYRAVAPAGYSERLSDAPSPTA